MIVQIIPKLRDFCKEFEAEMAKKALPSTSEAPKRRRKRMMSDAEVITILICFHFNSYRNFKHYYLGCVCQHWKHLFPKTFSYNRFVEVMPRCFLALTMFLKLACFGECSGISFVDSTCIPVIHNKRQFSMKCSRALPRKARVQWERTKIKDHRTNPTVFFLQEGYSPNSLYLLPPPPDAMSIVFLNNQARYNWGMTMRRTERGDTAVTDARVEGDGVPMAFSEAFGVEITEEGTPVNPQTCSGYA